MSNLVGDKNGIELWELMNKSNDPEEQQYLIDLNNAATKYGVIWFKDSVTQRNTGKNQTIWRMEWNGKQWEVSKFMTPKGASDVTPRMKPQEEVIIELDLSDILN